MTEPQGIGARVLRKEDGRFLHGRGSYVTNMMLPGQREVAFLRSPVAHAKLTEIRKPARVPFVFVRDDLKEALPIIGQSELPSYRPVAQHPLAHGKVRFVGEPIAMACARSRAQVEDLLELVEVDFDELPPITDAVASIKSADVLVHDEWADNAFITLQFESGFEELARQAKVIVKREITLSRQAMVPLEGLAVLAYWDNRTEQLVVYASSQSPHLLRIGIANFLSLDQRQVRVVAPDVGGGFGYKYNLHPEELCVAWLALKYRQPFRYIEDRREHLVARRKAILRGQRHRLPDRRVDRARRHQRRPHPHSLRLGPERLVHRANPELGRRVAAVVREDRAVGYRAERDQVTAFLLPPAWQDGPQEKKGRDEIDLHHPFELIVREHVQRFGDEDPGVVHEQIGNPAERIANGVNHAIGLFRDGDVCSHDDSALPQLLRAQLELFRSARDERHAHALAHEPARDREPDPPRAAGDERSCRPLTVRQRASEVRP